MDPLTWATEGSEFGGRSCSRQYCCKTLSRRRTGRSNTAIVCPAGSPFVCSPAAGPPGRFATVRSTADRDGDSTLATSRPLAWEARRRADQCRGEVSGGGDPQGALQARREQPTLSELIERYLAEEVEPKEKPRTLELYRYYLEQLVAPALGGRKANEVTPAAVDNLHRKLDANTKVTANRAIVALSGVYAFGGRRRLIAEGLNPARGIEKFPEQNRERYLSTDELARLGQALRVGETEGLAWPREPGKAASKHDRKPEHRKSRLSPYTAAAIRLLLFTGCRSVTPATTAIY